MGILRISFSKNKYLCPELLYFIVESINDPKSLLFCIKRIGLSEMKNYRLFLFEVTVAAEINRKELKVLC